MSGEVKCVEADPNTVIIVENDSSTGRRLKYYAKTADADYWTELWMNLRSTHQYRRELRGHFPHQLRSTFLKWVKPGARVLEAGCGLGHFTVAAAARGYRAEGLDWSEKMISHVRQLFPHIPWHVGDVRKLQFDDGTFDAVYSPGVCEHFEEGPTQILAETRRILRPGGFAVVSTPCFNQWLQERPDRLGSKSKPTGEFYQYAFEPEALSQVLQRIGFEVVQVRPYDALQTMLFHGGWKIPRPAAHVLSYAMDYLPFFYEKRGQMCIWVARRAG